MENFSQKQLELLSQLAREYDEKYRELEAICRSAQPETISHQLKLRSELTTDRFRGAQQALLTLIADDAGTGDNKALQAATALCRCFDEMRILFHMLLEHPSKTEQ